MGTQVRDGNACICAPGYEDVGGTCLAECTATTQVREGSACICAPGYKDVGGTCVAECTATTEERNTNLCYIACTPTGGECDAEGLSCDAITSICVEDRAAAPTES